MCAETKKEGAPNSQSKKKRKKQRVRSRADLLVFFRSIMAALPAAAFSSSKSSLRLLVSSFLASIMPQSTSLWAMTTMTAMTAVGGAAVSTSTSSLSSSSPSSPFLLMGKRDARSKRGKIFRGSNGVSRPASRRETGWWSGLSSASQVPPVPRPPPPSPSAAAAAASTSTSN